MTGMFAVMLLVAVIVAALLVVPLVIAMIRVTRRWSIASRSPLERSEAIVVEKRTSIGGSGRPTDQHYFVTFQFPSGQRLELDVPGRDSGLLVVGDRGTLEWQGPRYLGFAREILR